MDSWYDILSFNVTTPNNWNIKFHADTDNEDAIKALNDFYNDLKNKKETNKTKTIYDLVASLSTNTVNGKTIDGDNMVYKNFNIKQI